MKNQKNEYCSYPDRQKKFTLTAQWMKIYKRPLSSPFNKVKKTVVFLKKSDMSD